MNTLISRDRGQSDVSECFHTLDFSRHSAWLARWIDFWGLYRTAHRTTLSALSSLLWSALTLLYANATSII